MPNDARLGLLCGVGLVIAVAVVFFRRDVPIGTASSPAAFGSQSGQVQPAQPAQRPQIIARPTGLTPEQTPAPQLSVQTAEPEGRTLFHSAVRQDGAPPIGLIPQQETAPIARTLPGSR